MENVCCGTLEKLYETYRLPFFRPWILKDGEHNLTRGDGGHNLTWGDWMAKLFILTPDGEISKVPAPSIKLTFCPFCGVRLVAEETKEQ